MAAADEGDDHFRQRPRDAYLGESDWSPGSPRRRHVSFSSGEGREEEYLRVSSPRPGSTGYEPGSTAPGSASLRRTRPAGVVPLSHLEMDSEAATDTYMLEDGYDIAPASAKAKRTEKLHRQGMLYANMHVCMHACMYACINHA